MKPQLLWRKSLQVSPTGYILHRWTVSVGMNRRITSSGGSGSIRRRRRCRGLCSRSRGNRRRRPRYGCRRCRAPLLLCYMKSATQV